MQQVTEEQLAAAAVAPRVTEADVEANIVGEYYFLAGDAVDNCAYIQRESPAHVGSLELLTVCILVLKNGFTVMGKSACASPANFNPEIGRSLARKDAVGQVWGYMGYELRSKLQAANEAKQEDRG